MKETTHPDWERIKKVIDAYGMRKGFKRGEFLHKFISDVSADIEYLDKSYGDWQNFYKKLILVITKTYPDIALKKFLDENGNYELMENGEIVHLMNEDKIMKDWKETYNKL